MEVPRGWAASSYHPVTGSMSITAPAIPRTRPFATNPRARESVRPSRSPGIVVGGLLALHGMLAWVSRLPGEVAGFDSAVYILLGRSLREQRYVDLFQVGQPPHTLYPPGYPALLALVGGASNESKTAFVAFSILCSTVALAIVWLILRRFLPLWTSVIATASLALHPKLIDIGGQIMSDSPYMLFSLVAVWVVIRGRANTTDSAFAIVAILAATQVRMVGVALIAALLTYWAFQRRWRAAAVLACASGVVLGGIMMLMTRMSTSSVGQPYLSAIERSAATRFEPTHVVESLATTPDLVQVVLGRLHHIVHYLGFILPRTFLVPSLADTVWDNVLGVVVVTGGIGLGILVLIRKSPFIALYLGGYWAVLLAWRWSFDRLLFVVLPLLLLAVLLGVDAVVGRMVPRLRVAAMNLVALTLLLLAVPGTAALAQERTDCRIASGSNSKVHCVGLAEVGFPDALRYIRERTPAGAVVMTSRPAQMHLETGRMAVSISRAVSDGPEAVASQLSDGGANYLLLIEGHASVPKAFWQLLPDNCGSLSTEAVFPPQIYLFRVGGSPPGEGSACATVRSLSASARGPASDMTDAGSSP